jgi:hypothetical protein
VIVTVANDRDEPVISNALPTGNVAADTNPVTLSVDTNKAATCKYGTSSTANYDSLTSAFNQTGGTSHVAYLSNLANNTTYNYYVRCRTTVLNANTNSTLVTFTISRDSTAPTITSVNVFNITSTAASISWATSELADAQIIYSIDTSYSLSTSVDETDRTTHEQTLTGLTPSTLYHFKAVSRDSSDNSVTSTAFTFTTGGGAVSGEHIYIAQTTQGSDSGASCTTAHSIEWLNDFVAPYPVNWGVGSDKVGPGDTVHLCGTISDPIIPREAERQVIRLPLNLRRMRNSLHHTGH